MMSESDIKELERLKAEILRKDEKIRELSNELFLWKNRVWTKDADEVDSFGHYIFRVPPDARRANP